MDDKEHKELITRMADALREHSAPYKEGAWERFKAKGGTGGKRIMLLWWTSAVAASIVLGIGLFLLKDSFENPKNQVITLNKPQQEKESDIISDSLAEPAASTEKEEKMRILAENRSGAMKVEPNTLAKDAFEKSPQIIHPASDLLPNQHVEGQEKPVKVTDQMATESEDAQNRSNLAATKRAAKEEKREAKDDALFNMLREHEPNEEGKFELANQTGSNKHWNFSLVASPSMTNERVNIGGGVAVAYRITKKISIGSGVSLVNLGFKQDMGASSNNPTLNTPAVASLSERSPMFSVQSNETSELTSIHTNVLALDVPIDVKYHITNKFYTSVGFSLFAVLNEDRTNNYISTVATNSATSNFVSSYAVSEPEFQVMTTSEKSRDLPLQGNSYSGFLNFSVGRQMPLSKKVDLSVEPFFKLPVGTLSRQSVDFKYGGVRVITSF